jgi:hypothetical protein
MINTFMFFMFHPHQNIQPTLRKNMHIYWLNRSNLSNNRFIKNFNKLSRETSSARKETHQGSNSPKASLWT